MEKILVVDDNEASRDLIRAILKRFRCHIIEASNGQQALHLIQQDRPDLVLLDVDMPVLDGLTVMKRIRENTSLGDLPVVAVTAFAMRSDREMCLAAGFTTYLTKPIRAAELRQQVQRLIGVDA